MVGLSQNSRLARFASDRRGVSAVEFALILPILVTLFLGGYDVTDGMTINRKVTHVSSALSDLVGQSTTITNNDMKNILDAATSIMTPYSTSILKIIVTGVTIDVNGKAKVDWSDARNTSAFKVGASVTLPAGLNQGSFLVMTEVQYLFTPSFGYVITGAINFDESTYIKPRKTAKITRSP
jgi:Flp pilus assembly protein TadG